MNEDVPNHPGIYGVKIGSKYSVVYDGIKLRRELTCVRRKPIDLKGNYEYTISHEAEGWSDTQYPLKQGIPRNDAQMSIAESIRLTRVFAERLLKSIPDDAGIVVCLPLIRHKEGLEALKKTIREVVKSKRGLQFFSEAWASALATIPVKDAVGTNVLTLNFGSSTVEVTMHASKRLVEANVYTFGGSEIDKRLKNALMQEYRGVLADEDAARVIKEQYSWTKNNDISFVLTLEGAKHEIIVQGDVIRRIVSNAIDQLVKLVRNEFLRAAEMRDPEAVNSLQASGRGYLVLCGGMVNMEGFAEELYSRLVGVGAINENVQLAIPSDGVTAPAVGAWKVGQVLEDVRLERKLNSWEEISDSTTS